MTPGALPLSLVSNLLSPQNQFLKIATAYESRGDFLLQTDPETDREMLVWFSKQSEVARR